MLLTQPFTYIPPRSSKKRHSDPDESDNGTTYDDEIGELTRRYRPPPQTWQRPTSNRKYKSTVLISGFTHSPTAIVVWSYLVHVLGLLEPHEIQRIYPWRNPKHKHRRRDAMRMTMAVQLTSVEVAHRLSIASLYPSHLFEGSIKLSMTLYDESAPLGEAMDWQRFPPFSFAASASSGTTSDVTESSASDTSFDTDMAEAESHPTWNGGSMGSEDDLVMEFDAAR